MAEVRLGSARIDFIGRNAQFIAATRRNAQALRAQGLAIRNLNSRARVFNATAQGTVATMFRLRAALFALTGFGGLTLLARQVSQAGDRFLTLQARIRLSVSDFNLLGRVTSDVFKDATRPGGPFEALLTLLQQLSGSARTLRADTRDLSSISRAAATAATIDAGGSFGGISQAGREASGRFINELARERLSAEAARGLAGQSRRFAQAIADGLGVGIEALEDLASAGELTAQTVAVALATQADRLRGEFREVFGENVAVQVERTRTLLLGLAQSVRAPLEATTFFYQRLAQSTRRLELDQTALLAITQAVAQSLLVSGSSAKEASQSNIQFIQGLASNRLSGDELRSVLEQNIRLAQALSDGLGVTIGELRALGKAGALTTDVVVRALLSQIGQINEEFQNIPRTAEGALIQLQNRLLLAAGSATVLGGATAEIQRALDRLRNLVERPEFQEGLTNLIGDAAQGAAFLVENIGLIGHALAFAAASAGARALGRLFTGAVAGARQFADVARTRIEAERRFNGFRAAADQRRHTLELNRVGILARARRQAWVQTLQANERAGRRLLLTGPAGGDAGRPARGRAQGLLPSASRGQLVPFVAPAAAQQTLRIANNMRSALTHTRQLRLEFRAVAAETARRPLTVFGQTQASARQASLTVAAAGERQRISREASFRRRFQLASLHARQTAEATGLRRLNDIRQEHRMVDTLRRRAHVAALAREDARVATLRLQALRRQEARRADTARRFRSEALAAGAGRPLALPAPGRGSPVTVFGQTQAFRRQAGLQLGNQARAAIDARVLGQFRSASLHARRLSDEINKVSAGGRAAGTAIARIGHTSERTARSMRGASRAVTHWRGEIGRTATGGRIYEGTFRRINEVQKRTTESARGAARGMRAMGAAATFTAGAARGMAVALSAATAGAAIGAARVAAGLRTIAVAARFAGVTTLVAARGMVAGLHAVIITSVALRTTLIAVATAGRFLLRIFLFTLAIEAVIQLINYFRFLADEIGKAGTSLKDVLIVGFTNLLEIAARVLVDIPALFFAAGAASLRAFFEAVKGIGRVVINVIKAAVSGDDISDALVGTFRSASADAVAAVNSQFESTRQLFHDLLPTRDIAEGLSSLLGVSSDEYIAAATAAGNALDRTIANAIGVFGVIDIPEPTIPDSFGIQDIDLDTLPRLGQQAENTRGSVLRLSEAARDVGQAFSAFGKDVLVDFESIGDAARDLAKAILNAFLDALVFQPIANAISGFVAGAFGVPFLGGAGAGSTIPPAARGGVFADGGYAGRGLALVGERGPELVDFQNPARVYTAEQLAAGLGGGGGGTVINFSPVIQTADESGVRRALADILPQFSEVVRGGIAADLGRPSAMRQAARRR